MTEEEIKRLRSYLVVQSMKRTPVQIIEVLREARHQFMAAVVAVPDMVRFDEHSWSTIEIIEHVSLFMSSYETAICSVLQTGQRPPDVYDRHEIIPRRDKGETRDRLLLHLEKALNHLTSCVLQADPFVHLDITWKHFELGKMHWRAWLLFTRVHLLDHIKQVRQIQENIK